MGRKKKEMSLTDEERMFITKNHNLLLKFIYTHNIDIDQYYGALAEKFCRCIRNYDEAKGTLSAFVWPVLKREYGRIRTSENLLFKYTPPECMIYLDEIADEANHLEWSELIGGDEPAYLNIEAGDLIKDMKAYIRKNTKFDPERMEETFNLLLAGKNQTEISTYQGVSINAVNRRVKTLRQTYDKVRGNAYAGC